MGGGIPPSTHADGVGLTTKGQGYKEMTAKECAAAKAAQKAAKAAQK